MENSNQIVYTNWDPCNDIGMLGLTRMPFNQWIKSQDGIYLYAIDYRYRFNVKELDFAKLYSNVHILLDDTLEGFSYSSFKKVQLLVLEHKLQNKVVYATGHLDGELEYKTWLRGTPPNFNVYTMNSWYWRYRDWLVDCGNDVTIDKTIWYCCLQNRPRAHRQVTTVYLDYLNLLDHGIVSANINDVVPGRPELFSHWPSLKSQALLTQTKMPLCVDIPGTSDKCTPNDLNPQIYNTTLINLVSETFYMEKGNNIISEMFLTEKTYKAFAAYQIPIIIGPKGTVERLRSYGFDMFDDIIDHSYDHENGDIRLFLAIDNLKRIVYNSSIEELNQSTKNRRIKNKQLYINGIDIDNPVVNYICM